MIITGAIAATALVELKKVCNYKTFAIMKLISLLGMGKYTVTNNYGNPM